MKCIYKDLYNTTENLFNGIVVFMIVSLKKSIPVVIGSLPEAKITSKWLKCEINKYILGLAEVGFKVRAANDDHPSNVNAFTRLHEIFDGDNKTFIKHPAYADFARKTYLSIFRCNPSIQKHQKESDKSKEICVSVISIWSVSWRNPCSRLLHIMEYISWSAWKRRKSSGSSKKSAQNNVPGDASW